MTEVFPKTISEQQYGHGTSNTIQKVTVEFAYRYWRNLGTEPNRPIGLVSFQDIMKYTITKSISSQIPTLLRRLFFN